MAFEFQELKGAKFLPPELLFWFYEEWESALQWCIRQLLPIGGTFIDVGANTGIMGLLACHHRGAHVHFIEPHPRLARLITQNVELNSFVELTHVWEEASTSSDETVRLQESLSSDAGHHIIASTTTAGCDFLSVRGRRLAHLFEEGHIHFADLIKVDCEGHDEAVISGLGEFCQPRFVGAFYVEESTQHLISKFNKAGYRPYNSRQIWIDGLRCNPDRASTFFAHVTDSVRQNALWCAIGGEIDRFLSRQIGPSAKSPASLESPFKLDGTVRGIKREDLHGN